jgi:hypothetical protein
VVIKSRTSKKNVKFNDQKKKYNDLQNNAQKLQTEQHEPYKKMKGKIKVMK